MTLLHKEIFVCVDCETTGLDLDIDRIIEVGAVRFTFEQELDRIESLIDPECPIPESSIAIHHISFEMVAGKPKIHEFLPQLLQFIGRSIIVGHGVGFDITMIANAANRANIPCQLTSNKVVDTLRLARLYGDSPTNSLETLRQHFNIGEENAHRAMGDATVNMEVFKKLSQKYNTTEQLLQAVSKPVRLKTMPLGKHKGRPFQEVPLDYLSWAANKPFDEDLLFSIRSELKRRKKGSGFADTANPFHGL
jgi:DNA polymerase III subunit epsilon